MKKNKSHHLFHTFSEFEEIPVIKSSAKSKQTKTTPKLNKLRGLPIAQFDELPDGKYNSTMRIEEPFSTKHITKGDLGRSATNVAVSQTIPLEDTLKRLEQKLLRSKNRHKNSHVSSIPDWISLREHYMRQLESSVTGVILLCDTAQSVMAEKEKHHFLSILVAIRKVTVQMILRYHTMLSSQVNTRNPTDNSSPPPQMQNNHTEPLTLDDVDDKHLTVLREYLLNVCSSMSWLASSGNPFVSWMGGIETGLNPLFLTCDITGQSVFLDAQTHQQQLSVARVDNFWTCSGSSGAVRTAIPSVSAASLVMSSGQKKESSTDNNAGWDYSSSLVNQLPSLLQYSEEDFLSYKLASNVLRDVYLEWCDSMQRQAQRRHNRKVQRKQQEKSADAALTFLLFDHHNKKKLESDFYASSQFSGFNALSRWFRVWRRQYGIELRIKEMYSAKNLFVKNKVFHSLTAHLRRCRRIRSMQVARSYRVKRNMFGCWIAHVMRCRAFYSLVARSVVKFKRFFLHKLYHYAQHNFHNRDFVRNVQRRRKQTTLRCLKNNVVLNRFALKNRLRSWAVVSVTFHEKFITLHCFSAWKQHSLTHSALRRISTVMHTASLREAMFRWKESHMHVGKRETALMVAVRLVGRILHGAIKDGTSSSGVLSRKLKAAGKVKKHYDSSSNQDVNISHEQQLVCGKNSMPPRHATNTSNQTKTHYDGEHPFLHRLLEYALSTDPHIRPTVQLTSQHHSRHHEQHQSGDDNASHLSDSTNSSHSIKSRAMRILQRYSSNIASSVTSMYRHYVLKQPHYGINGGLLTNSDDAYDEKYEDNVVGTDAKIAGDIAERAKEEKVTDALEYLNDEYL